MVHSDGCPAVECAIKSRFCEQDGHWKVIIYHFDLIHLDSIRLNSSLWTHIPLDSCSIWNISLISFITDIIIIPFVRPFFCDFPQKNKENKLYKHRLQEIHV